MGVALFFNKQRASIDSVVLDCSLSESHVGDVEVTDHPVEQGANISDHRRRKPSQLTIEGIISNTPLPKDGDPVTTVTAGGVSWQSRSSGDAVLAPEAFQTLLDLLDADRLITVITALRTYENMTLVSLNVPRDASTGQALRFTATLREIRLVRNDTVTINAKTTRAQKQTDLHKKAKTDAVDKRSLALQIQEDGIQKASANLFKTLLGGAK